jgi:alkyldihydroxyacetonephosphate synthase
MRWWGWGREERAPRLPRGALSFLADTVGVSFRPRPPVALGAVHLPSLALAEATLAKLRAVLGEQDLRSDRGERVRHAAGKGYCDLVRMRAGAPVGAPDAVAHPRSREQLRALLDVCAKRSVAVVPFGGGTSVVGGLEPLRGEHAGVISLDLGALDAVLDLDERSLLVTVQAGLGARELERRLAPRGLTLGHFPQSFEHVSLGGCAATRSAGQASSGYGRFEQMVKGVGLCAPAGTVDLAPFPASAAGPDLRQTIVGSEGALGVIDRLTLRLRPAPRERLYEGVFFESFASGMQALRQLAQERAAPDVARLSDEPETRMSLALAAAGRGDSRDGAQGLSARALHAAKGRASLLYLRARGYGDGCLAIFGFEDEPGRAQARQRCAREVAKAHGGLPVGASPGRAWLASRYEAPYLRDEMLTYGVLVETLETAASWSSLAPLHRRVAEAIAGALEGWGTPGLVACHVSHVYETGASLYFTFIARQSEGREIEQWQAVKRAASVAILEGGGTISHHHALGRDHLPWLEDEIGSEGVRALRALKHELDPAGIMNPGKLAG